MSNNKKIKESILIKDEEDTNWSYGYKPSERPTDLYLKLGIINLDKPPGPTSHQVAAWVKQIIGLGKVGHGGTLDPDVTGVLPIGLLNATSSMHYITESNKSYVGIIKLHGKVNKEKIEELFTSLHGKLYQRPPQKSAVRRKLRTREIYKLDLIELEDRNIFFQVDCQHGFYVRKLAHDIGLILGVDAHLSELRRIKAGPFIETESMCNLYDVLKVFNNIKTNSDYSELKNVVLPIESVFINVPKIIIRDSSISSIAHGAALSAPGVLQIIGKFTKNNLVLLSSLKGEAVSICTAQMDYDEILKADKGIVAKSNRVFMNRDLYPRLWRKNI